MKKIIFLLGLITSSLYAQKTMENSIHQFTVEALEGEHFNFSDLKGKKMMVVNTASKCGLTPQYKALQSLYETYESEGFVIVGFPANNFMYQEPGANEEIAAFCERNFGVTFPMMAKIDVKGKEIHPVYYFLTHKDQNGVMDSKVTWNFQKYLVNEEGIVEKVISPRTSPDDQEIIDWITK